MSHLHNLFHRATQPTNAPSRIPVVPAATPVPSETFVPAVAAVPVVATAVADAPPEFAVEQAHLNSASRLVFHSDPRSPAADRFRFLRMRLREHWTAGKLKKLLITSPLAGDGKSTVLLNLATALAERGKRSVLVIEGDLHHSLLTQNLNLRPWAGLAECLIDESISPLSQIRRVEPLGFHLLPAGEPRRNPTELLQTHALRLVLEKVSASFDWVLMDSPPVIALTDAIALQQHTDASLLVVRAGRTPQEAVEQAVDFLGSKNIVGVVLNGIERRNEPSYQQGYYGAGAGSRHDDD